jgi:exonuclease SbcC
MKILSIEIENIASIEHAFIDFENGPLADESLFLICGETGSGKSTILDAVCLALYAKAPRMDRRSNDRKELKTDAVSKDKNEAFYNPLHLLRKGTIEGKSVVRFMGNDKCTYKAEFRMYHKLKSLKNEVLRKWVLTNEKSSIDMTTVGAINSTVNNVVGLNYEQFIQTTILAQGRFAEFLKADNKSKASILEMLTGNEIYSRISSKIHEKQSAIDASLKFKKGLLENLSLLTTDELEALTEECQKIETELNVIKKETNDIKVRQSWLTEHTEIESDIKKAQAQVESAQQSANSDESKQLQQTIRLYSLTEVPRKVLSEKRDIDNRICSDDVLEKQYIGDFSILLAKCKRLQEERDKIQNDIEAKQRHLNELKSHEVMATNYQSVTTVLNGVMACQTRVKAETKSLKEEQERLNLNNADKEVIQNRLDEQKATSESLAKELDEKRNEMNKQPRTELFNTSQQYSKLAAELQLLKTNYNNRQEKSKEIDAKKESLKSSESELEGLTKKLAELKECAVQKERLYEEAKSKLLRHSDTVADFTKRLRASLVEGVPCPVCGSTTHHIEPEEFFQKQLEISQNESNCAERTLQECRDAITRTETEIRQTKASIEKETKELSDMNARMPELLNEQKDCFEKIGREIADSEIDNEITANKNKQDKVAEDIKAITNLENCINDMQKKWEAAKSAERETEKKLNEIVNKVVQTNEKIKGINTNISRNNELITTDLERLSSQITITDWRSTWDTDPQKVIDEIVRIATDYNTTASEHETLLTRIEKANTTCDDNSSLTSKIQALSPALAQCTASPDIPDNNLKGVDIQLAKVQTQLDELYRRMAENKEKSNSLKEQIESFVNDNGDNINVEQLQHLSTLTAEVIASYERHLQKQREELTIANTTLGNAKERFERHIAKDDSVITESDIDKLNERTQELTASANALSERATEIKAKLKLNDDNRSASEEKRKEIEQIEADKVYWDTLDRIFGSKDGSKFRNIAQAYTLRYLLTKANVHMRQINDRYTLECENNSLSILVRDNHMAGEIRMSSTLSGGETFLVSLALALGLSSISDRKLQVETLFIDEGFGSLSPNCLEDVTSTLERLQSQGRKIGIISHVAELSDRIKTKILLKKTNGKSIVEVTK